MVVSIFDQYAWPTGVDCAMAYDFRARKTRRPGFNQNLPEVSSLLCANLCKKPPICIVRYHSGLHCSRLDSNVSQCTDLHAEQRSGGQFSAKSSLPKSTGRTKQGRLAPNMIGLVGWSFFCRISCFPYEWRITSANFCTFCVLPSTTPNRGNPVETLHSVINTKSKNWN